MKQVSAGVYHSCGVSAEGRPHCWGDNTLGQLGIGMEEDMQEIPAPLSGDLLFSKMSSGTSHTCGIAPGGRAYCWGENGSGQLGIGTVKNQATPVSVSGDLTFSDLEVGISHTCGITPDGHAYCWGSGRKGVLGNGGMEGRTVPTRVSGGLHFSSLSTGASHTCGITSDHRAYCWGNGAEGRLGNGDTQNLVIPTRVAGDHLFSKVSVGSTHTCAITTTGAAYCWGGNGEGQLGNGDRKNQTTPVLVSGNLRFRKISSGGSHTCAITPQNRTYCWGDNTYGQLGNGNWDSETAPTQVSENRFFSKVSAGAYHTCGVTVGKRTYCWGDNGYGQLGTGDQEVRTGPALISSPQSEEETPASLMTKIEAVESANPKFAHSDQSQLTELFIQRVRTNEWIQFYPSNGSNVSIVGKPPQELRNASNLIYRITDQQFANTLGLLTHIDYRLSDLAPHQGKEILRFLREELPPYPFETSASNLPNPLFNPINISDEDRHGIEQLLGSIRTKMQTLPYPNSDHLDASPYVDDRVGVQSNQYDNRVFLKILLAMKMGDRETFVAEMAQLGTSFPGIHAQARNGLLHTLAHLYVTGRFPSVGVKRTYYHFLLRCGQIFS